MLKWIVTCLMFTHATAGWARELTSMACVVASEPTETHSSSDAPIVIQLKSVIAIQFQGALRNADFSYIFTGLLDGRLVEFTVPVTMTYDSSTALTRRAKKKLNHDWRWMEGTVVKSALDALSKEVGRITLQKNMAEPIIENVSGIALNPFEAFRNFLNLTKKQIGEFIFLADELKISLSGREDQSLQTMLNVKWAETIQDPSPASPEDLQALWLEQKQREEQDRAAKTGPRQKQN